jgi:hypothetical protein
MPTQKINIFKKPTHKKFNANAHCTLSAATQRTNPTQVAAKRVQLPTLFLITLRSLLKVKNIKYKIQWQLNKTIL